jgi:hypothetical protein
MAGIEPGRTLHRQGLIYRWVWSNPPAWNLTPAGSNTHMGVVIKRHSEYSGESFCSWSITEPLHLQQMRVEWFNKCKETNGKYLSRVRASSRKVSDL